MRVVCLPIPTPYPVGPVNACLLPGPPVTLVDCGPKTEAAMAALREGLASEHLEIRQVERLVLTHGHIDHFGLAAAVVEASGAEVCAHRCELPKLTGGRSLVDPMRELLSAGGFPSEVGGEILLAFRALRPHFDPVEPSRLLADGDLLPLSDGAAEVLHTPGHSRGHICLASGDTLLSGDLLLQEISPNPFVEFDGEGRRLHTLPDLLASLARIAALPLVNAYPGHGSPFSDPCGRALGLLRHHQARKERLARLVAGRPMTVREVVDAAFPGLERIGLVLGISEVLGHFDLLEADDRLVVESRSGVLYYSTNDTDDPQQGVSGA